MNNIVTLPIGDWSDDGHGKCIEIDVETNYPTEQLQQAYKDSCKLTGVSFNHNDNFTGIKEDWVSRKKREICTEYEEYEISEFAYERLKEFGLKDDERLDEDNLYIQDAEHLVELIMWFISLSMPDDFKYKLVEKNRNYLNGYWGNLNVQFGYGLF